MIIRIYGVPKLFIIYFKVVFNTIIVSKPYIILYNSLASTLLITLLHLDEF